MAGKSDLVRGALSGLVDTGKTMFEQAMEIYSNPESWSRVVVSDKLDEGMQPGIVIDSNPSSGTATVAFVDESGDTGVKQIYSTNNLIPQTGNPVLDDKLMEIHNSQYYNQGFE